MEVDRRTPRVMVVEVSTSPTLQIGPPVMLFPGGTNPAGSPRPLYDVTADGQRFLMSASLLAPEVGDRTDAQVHIVLNWTEELKARLPGLSVDPQTAQYAVSHDGQRFLVAGAKVGAP